jgi:hypothetical protein
VQSGSAAAGSRWQQDDKAADNWARLTISKQEIRYVVTAADEETNTARTHRTKERLCQVRCSGGGCRRLVANAKKEDNHKARPARDASKNADAAVRFTCNNEDIVINVYPPTQQCLVFGCTYPEFEKHCWGQWEENPKNADAAKLPAGSEYLQDDDGVINTVFISTHLRHVEFLRHEN